MTTSTPANPTHNLLMLSGDNRIARGIGGAFDDLLARFAPYWQRIDIITPAAPDATPRTLHGNVYVHPADGHRLWQPLFIRRKGRQLMAQRPYHLVVSHDFGFYYNGIGAYMLLRGKPVPLVSEIHHVEGYPHATTRRERLWRLAAQLYIPFAAKRVAAFRVVNQYDTPRILRQLGVRDEQILVLHSLYLDHSTYRPLDAVAPQYDLLFVGRLARNKGILTILEALHLLKQERPDMTLAIRGDGDLRPQIEAFIAQHQLDDNVIWLPPTDDAHGMARLYNQARLLVCASTVEGNPRVTLEAMACGTAVLSTPVGIMPEVIENGVNGFIVGDEHQMAARALWLLANDDARQSMAAAGRQTAQGFHADGVVAQYAQGYHALIARERQRQHP